MWLGYSKEDISCSEDVIGVGIGTNQTESECSIINILQVCSSILISETGESIFILEI